ncbi:G-type lectin S-receptor-like serine/threonine-protein kinase At5g35370 [Phragmites australis]|uniref:G-type lectin S-receptor-like serine/threonine-protein kinase At5g35370 n=1 Tax=Phragmites australis TaxID=29695 RepID=UPI002D77C2BD|nr:G-type lectin S-receptor-like serine/threonine-protein kinase At5g35370 [Phragmites australis]
MHPGQRSRSLTPPSVPPSLRAVHSYASWAHPLAPHATQMTPLAPRPLACLGLFLILLCARGADAGSVATELVYPNFTASWYEYIDTGGAFLESKNGAFRAAVFNPGKQQANFYLVVLHAPYGTPVWSANRVSPMTSTGRIQLFAQGLAVSDTNGTVLWSTPSQLRSPVAALRLQDSGNLQLLDAGNVTLWQSFDNATDTLLPGQQLLAGAYLSAARSATDLSEGDYRLGVTAADLVLTWQGATYWRLSNDIRSYKDRNVAVASLSVNASGLFAVAADGALVFRVDLPAANFRVLNLGYDGRLRIKSYALVNSSASLGSDFVAPAVDCDLPLQCPILGLCSPAGNSSTCTCPPLFAASVSTPGACTPGDGSALASPASCRSNSTASVSYLALKSQTAYFATKFDPPTKTGVNHPACRGLCNASCDCLGYFYDNSSLSCYLVQEKQLGSLYWSSSATALGYIKTFNSAHNATRNKANSSSANRSVVPIVLPSIAAFLLVAVIAWYACWRRWKSMNGKKKKAKNTGVKKVHLGRQKSPSRDTGNAEADDDEQDEDIVIPGMPTRFSYMEIAAMTANFGTKIGSGGFGSVYKGELPGGEGLVAVKKLEAIGVHAKREFCTEITIIGNIRHVNLVRLRGFCAEGSRRLLVYEYMNRSSLDRSLFGRTGPVLEWGERMEVALGAARGLAYLHTGCNQKIVHCDVKPENILLADGGQVKIADFGLAKLMSPEQSAMFTTMRGTRGYLAPEWLSNAAISDRADVYSFGMVLLELIHGRKNRGEQANDVAIVGSGEQSDWPSGWSSAAASTPSGTASGGSDNEYFPMVALELHEQGRYLDLVDSRLEGRVDEAESSRAVRVALCCLHEDPALRPSMAAVVRMLEGITPPPEPRVEALGFLRLYGRGYAVPTSLVVMAGTPGSAGGTSSITGGSQLNESLQDMSAPS